MFKSDDMRDRLGCIGCYPTEQGVRAANEEGADKLREGILADLADLSPADLLAVRVITSTLNFDAERAKSKAALVA